MAEGSMVRGLAADGRARALRVEVDEIARHGATLHGLTDTAAEWFREGMVCSALLSAYLDDDERLTVQVQAEKPRFAFTADVHAHGGLRARLSPSDVRGSETIHGMMLVMKSVVGREVYRGVTEVAHPSFAAMLEEHLRRSSQTVARVEVEGGVGVLVETLPGATDVPDLEAEAATLITGMEGEVQPLRWECACSEERVLAMIRSLGPSEVQAMIDEDHGAVITCNFCTREVHLSEDALRGLL